MDFNDLSPEDQQAIIERIKRARTEASQLMIEGRYADAFDLVYYTALIDPESFKIAMRFAYQVENIHRLRPDQLEVLRQHAEEGRPLAQYLYGYWLWFNRKRMEDTYTVIELFEAASKFGIGDASNCLSYMYGSGEAGHIDEQLEHHYSELASSQQLNFKNIRYTIRNHIYGRNGEPEEPQLTITILRDIIGLPKDTDLRWQTEREEELKTEAAENANPFLWTFLYECYNALGLRWAGEIYTVKGIEKGDYSCYNDLIWCRCVDSKDDEGNLLPEKMDEYNDIVRRGAEAGSCEMMLLYARILQSEYNDEETTEKRRQELAPQIRKWLERSSELGHAEAPEVIAFAIVNSEYGYEKDPDEIWRYFHLAAMRGRHQSYCCLSIIAAEMDGVDSEESEFTRKPWMDDLPSEEWERIGRLIAEKSNETWMGDLDDDDDYEQEIEED